MSKYDYGMPDELKAVMIRHRAGEVLTKAEIDLLVYYAADGFTDGITSWAELADRFSGKDSAHNSLVDRLEHQDGSYTDIVMKRNEPIVIQARDTTPRLKLYIEGQDSGQIGWDAYSVKAHPAIEVARIVEDTMSDGGKLEITTLHLPDWKIYAGRQQVTGYGDNLAGAILKLLPEMIPEHRIELDLGPLTSLNQPS